MILICDDEPHVVRLLQVNLERMGYRVVSARDGQEGIEKITADRPDFVVLDVVMPYIDGVEVYRRMRKNPETANIPVVFISTQPKPADFENQIGGENSGTHFWIQKPFDAKDLAAFLVDAS